MILSKVVPAIIALSFVVFSFSPAYAVLGERVKYTTKSGLNVGGTVVGTTCSMEPTVEEVLTVELDGGAGRVEAPRSQFLFQSESENAIKAKKAFESEDFELAKTFAGLEVQTFPVNRIGAVQFREAGEVRDYSSEIGLVPPSDDQFVYLFKCIPTDLLPNISSSGLDTLFGGRGGASELVGLATQKKASVHDRGRQFLAPTFPVAMLFCHYIDSSKKGPTTLLRVRIPLAETLSLNLTHSHNSEEYYIAGSVIPPKWIEALSIPGAKITEALISINQEIVENTATDEDPTDKTFLKAFEYFESTLKSQFKPI